ncbi:hypothetical protein B0J14DRAFT_453261, partial [Halenospora varia]
ETLGRKDLDVAYTDRSAVSAILQNPLNQQIALIHVMKVIPTSFPGSGIEPDEDHSIAVMRESLEETGCKVLKDIGTCYAMSEEWRNDLHQ